MKILDYFDRKRSDKIKRKIAAKTAKYYIKKNSEEILELKKTLFLEHKAEKKGLSDYYNDRLSTLQEKIELLEKDNKFLRSEYKKYSDLLNDLERVSGGISMDNLHKEINKIFVQFNKMKDTVELISEKHERRKIIGVK